jgi:pimeloyl-ACP methyl ester carboxylesterase
LKVPTLILAGSDTASADLKRAVNALRSSLPNSRLFVFKGQEHNAMDTVPQQFADALTRFLRAAQLY